MITQARLKDAEERLHREVRCTDSGQLIGYVTTDGAAACLERALAEHGFQLTPTSLIAPRLRQTAAVA